MKNHALRRGSESDDINFIDRGVNPARPERHGVDIIECGYPGKYEDRLKARLETGQNVGTQIVTHNDSLL